MRAHLRRPRAQFFALPAVPSTQRGDGIYPLQRLALREEVHLHRQRGLPRLDVRPNRLIQAGQPIHITHLEGARGLVRLDVRPNRLVQAGQPVTSI